MNCRRSYIFGLSVGAILMLALMAGVADAHVGQDQPATDVNSQPTTDNQPTQTDSHGNISAMIVEPDLFPATTPLTIWLEVKDTKTNAKLTDLTPRVTIKNPQGVALNSGNTTLKGDKYFFEYTFSKPGDYKLVAHFTHEGQEHESVFTIPVSAATSAAPASHTTLYIWWIVAGVLLLLVVIWVFGLTRQEKKIKQSVIASIVTVVAGGLVYSLAVVFTTGAIKTGVVTCLENGSCYWTAHIHGYYPISICGEEYRLPIEQGPLGGPHTHEEKNISHWHDRLSYDQKSGQITETDPLLVATFFKSINVPLTNQSITDKENGDNCPTGAAGTLKAFVNGQYTPHIVSHIWQDKEVISIFFDERTPQEIEAGLKAKPVEFPTLGRG